VLLLLKYALASSETLNDPTTGRSPYKFWLFNQEAVIGFHGVSSKSTSQVLRQEGCASRCMCDVSCSILALKSPHTIGGEKIWR